MTKPKLFVRKVATSRKRPAAVASERYDRETGCFVDGWVPVVAGLPCTLHGGPKLYATREEAVAVARLIRKQCRERYARPETLERP